VKDKTDKYMGHSSWVWKSGYTIYYYIGALYSDAINNPKYMQLYFYDPKDALMYCMGHNKDLNRGTMCILQNMLLSINHYRQLFYHTFEILKRTPLLNLTISIVADPSTNLHRYNALSVNKIAIVIPGINGRAPDP
jgi:hypothetical protein